MKRTNQKQKIIDCHVHAYTNKQIKNLLLSMKKNGISKAVIMYWPLKGGMNAPIFEKVLKNIESHNNLFMAFSLRMTDDKAYKEQIEKLEPALKNIKIVGVKLYLGYEHFFANDQRCDRIYQACMKYKKAVIFHTGDTWNYKTALVRYANPIYVDDVAVKYPDLKILISHMGNPCWIKETAEVIYKNENVFTDFSGTLSFPSQLEKEYNANLKKQILELIAYCSTPRKIMFGSDFFLYGQNQYVKFLNGFKDISKIDMEYIKHKNAEKLFGI